MKLLVEGDKKMSYDKLAGTAAALLPVAVVAGVAGNFVKKSKKRRKCKWA